jgi:Trp operon repressor
VERKVIGFRFAVIHNILCGVNSLRIRSIEAVRNLAIDALTRGTLHIAASQENIIVQFTADLLEIFEFNQKISAVVELRVPHCEHS